MPTICIDLDKDAFYRLAELAIAERRTIPWHAEWLLLRAIWPDGSPGASQQAVSDVEQD